MKELHNRLFQEKITIEEAEALQTEYSLLLKEFERESKKFLSIGDVRLIAAVDMSYFKQNDNEWGVACAVLWDLKSNEIISYKISQGQVLFDYKPSFLGFRECPLLVKVLNSLEKKPDVIMCDGHGIIHPKRFGEAVQLGMVLDIPSFGVAKNPFIGYSDWKEIKRNKGNKTPILAEKLDIDKNSKPELLGYAICLNDEMKPVFISVGYKCDLDLALKISLMTTKNHRQPEPLFLADKFSKKFI